VICRGLGDDPIYIYLVPNHERILCCYLLGTYNQKRFGKGRIRIAWWGDITLPSAPDKVGPDECATSFVRIDSTDIHHDIYQYIHGYVGIANLPCMYFLGEIPYKHCSIGFVVRYQEEIHRELARILLNR
jgi:hypothetical protein